MNSPWRRPADSYREYDRAPVHLPHPSRVLIAFCGLGAGHRQVTRDLDRVTCPYCLQKALTAFVADQADGLQSA